MREIDRERSLLEARVSLIQKRNFLTRLHEAHCITELTIVAKYTDTLGNRDEIISAFRGKELSLLIPIMDLPGLRIESTSSEVF